MSDLWNPKLGISAKRFPTTSGRFYGPTDLDIYHSNTAPLKPSWTNVASIEASPGLSEWYKKNGRWADIDGPVTAIIGSITHECVDLMNNGELITTDFIENMLDNWSDMRWRLIYHNKWIAIELIKKQLMGYQAWFEMHQPKIICSELMMWHPDVPYAGTADLLLKIHEKKQDKDIYMLADLKTGNENEKHNAQCMAYAMLAEKIYNIKISAIGALYCNGRWRGAVKPGKMKVKIIRDKDYALTAQGKKLADKVLKTYQLWESCQTKPQPDKRIKLPNEFQLKINNKG